MKNTSKLLQTSQTFIPSAIIKRFRIYRYGEPNIYKISTTFATVAVVLFTYKYIIKI